MLYLNRTSSGTTGSEAEWSNGTLSVQVFYNTREPVTFPNIAMTYEDYEPVDTGRYTRTLIENERLIVNEGQTSCVFLPADMGYKVSDETMKSITSRNLHPIVLYTKEEHPDEAEARAVFEELYNLIDRALAAKVPINMTVKETGNGLIKRNLV